jgi:hypothetical protein
MLLCFYSANAPVFALFAKFLIKMQNTYALLIGNFHTHNIFGQISTTRYNTGNSGFF